MDPIGTESGVKMPTLLGLDARSGTVKCSGSYPIYSDAQGRACAYLVGHPDGVYLSPDLANNPRGLFPIVGGAAPYTSTTRSGWVTESAFSQGYSANPGELAGLYQISSSLRIASFGANFQLSSAIINQQGNCAVRIDYARRFADYNIPYNVYQDEDVLSFENASNGQDVTVMPATSGFSCFGVPISGSEDWHATRTIGYNASSAGVPIVGYGLSSTDEEQSTLIALNSNSVINNTEMSLMLRESHGAWATIMICWVGLPVSIQVGTLNVAMHLETIPKSKGLDFSSPQFLPHPSSMLGAQLMLRGTPKVRTWSEKMLDAGKKVFNFGGGIVKSLFPDVVNNASQIASQLIGGAFGAGGKIPVAQRFISN